MAELPGPVLRLIDNLWGNQALWEFHLRRRRLMASGRGLAKEDWSAWRQALDMVQGDEDKYSIWQRVITEASDAYGSHECRKACLAVIAWPEAASLLDRPLEEIRLLAALGDPKSSLVLEAAKILTVS